MLCFPLQRGIVPYYNMTESVLSRKTANFLLYSQVSYISKLLRPKSSYKEFLRLVRNLDHGFKISRHQRSSFMQLQPELTRKVLRILGDFLLFKVKLFSNLLEVFAIAFLENNVLSFLFEQKTLYHYVLDYKTVNLTQQYSCFRL